MLKLIVFVYFLKLILASENYKDEIDSIDNLPYDAEERLSSNIFLTPSHCVNWSNEGIDSVNSDLRDKYIINGEFKELLGLSISSKVQGCWGICVDRGTTKDLIEHPMLYHIYSEATEDVDMATWYSENCQQAEIGFVSYHPTPLDVYWIAPWGEKLHRAILEKGEKYTFWSQSWLGHQFELIDSRTNEIVMKRTVEFNGIHAVGEKPTLKKTLSMEREIENTLVNALIFKYKNELSNINGELRPGIVHRIDKETSGLLVIAKNNFSHSQLWITRIITLSANVSFSFLQKNPSTSQNDFSNESKCK